MSPAPPVLEESDLARARTQTLTAEPLEMVDHQVRLDPRSRLVARRIPRCQIGLRRPEGIGSWSPSPRRQIWARRVSTYGAAVMSGA